MKNIFAKSSIILAIVFILIYLMCYFFKIHFNTTFSMPLGIYKIIFESFIKQIDTLFLKQKSDLETFKVNIINDIKEHSAKSRKKLKTIINEISTNINTKSEIKQDNNLNNSKKINLNYLLIFFAGQIIFLLIGLIIGITI
ncbi:conjugal transfer protein TraM [Campylobacter sp.]|uniref:conjugal transfer protein TraM n=1 Tax=Campylobacter sp. TaxID=205 RepID=UPI0025C1A2B2|nr:conjugal transfer protein TraM [Campylobacter sp.]